METENSVDKEKFNKNVSVCSVQKKQKSIPENKDNL